MTFSSAIEAHNKLHDGLHQCNPAGCACQHTPAPRIIEEVQPSRMALDSIKGLKGVILRVFRVPSHTNKALNYYVQVLKVWRRKHPLYFCNCFDGYQKLVLALAGVDDVYCKHVSAVMSILAMEDTAKVAQSPFHVRRAITRKGN